MLLSCTQEDSPKMKMDEGPAIPITIETTTAYNYYLHKDSLRAAAPYTYMMNKYLDIALEYLYGWNSTLPTMSIELKQSMINSYAEDNASDLEDQELHSSDLDSFFDQLHDSLITELNTFPAVQYRITESLSISEIDPADFDSTDMIICIGEMAYNKLEILRAAENQEQLLHESFDLEEELSNNNCDCNYQPIYSPTKRQSTPNRLTRYFLHSLWLTDIRYRNYNNSCPNMTTMLQAMAEWESASLYSIHFREIADNGWNRFSWGIGCNYHVKISDYSGLGVSSLGAVPWAFCYVGSAAQLGTYMHELGHVLGLLHEHMRPDRDCYIDIEWSNMDYCDRPQFHKFLDSSVRVYGDFDFNSIMLYDSYAASKNNHPTILKKDGTTYTANRCSLSVNDIQYIQYLYH